MQKNNSGMASRKDISCFLVAKTPVRFYVPRYIGDHGWSGVWLDFRTPVWNEISELLKDTYLLKAPNG